MQLKFLHDLELYSLGLAADFHRSLNRFTNIFDFPKSLFLQNGTPLPVIQKDESVPDFSSRLQRFWEQFLQNVGYQESISYASRDQATLREELSNEPILRNCTAQRGADNSDINLNSRISPAATTTNLRQRTYDMVPIATILYFPISALASSESARSIINEYAGKGIKIPRYLHEMLQTNRKSTLGPLSITPSFVGLPSSVVSSLNLQNTIFDFDWLITRVGVTSFFSLLSRISNYDSNYIEFVEFTSAIPLESGFTTTMMAFTVISIPSSNVNQVTYFATSTAGKPSAPVTIDVPVLDTSSLMLHPSNTYEKGIPNGAHLYDAYVQQRCIQDSSGKTIDLSSSTNEIVLSGDSPSRALFILKRMTTFKNSVKSGRPRPPAPGAPLSDTSSLDAPKPNDSPKAPAASRKTGNIKGFVNLGQNLTKLMFSKFTRKQILLLLKELLAEPNGFTNHNKLLVPLNV